MTLFVAESIDDSRKVFSVLGSEYRVTSWAWLNLPLVAAIGILVAFLFGSGDTASEHLLVGLGYGLLIAVASFLHGVGHVLSSRLVDAPVARLVATATVTVIQYDDVEDPPRRVDVARSLGGPVLNLSLGLVAGAVWAYAGHSHFFAFFAFVNFAFGAFTLLPILSLDGAVIWPRLGGGHASAVSRE